MVAIVSGNNLGLNLTSLDTLGQNGVLGQATQGRNGEGSYVDVATGNLVLQDRDDFVAATGLDIDVVRTYNSQGAFNDDNGDNWGMGAYTAPLRVVGTLNAAGSYIVLTGADGAQATYSWTGSNYRSTAGAGAYDTIAAQSSSGLLQWTDGATGNTSLYEGSGKFRLLSQSDTSGNKLTYTYVNDGLPGDRLASVTSDSGDRVSYTYTALGQLSAVQRYAAAGVGAGILETTTSYSYDTLNRLSGVTVDLTPADGSIADGNIYTTTYTYAGVTKNVETISQSDGTHQAFTYVSVAGVERVATVVDGLGQTTAFAYDTANRTTTVTDPLGLRTVYGYDGAGQLTSISGPAAGAATRSVSFGYDGDGNVTQVTDGDGNVSTMTYDSRGNLLSRIDGQGDQSTFTYDARNQLLTQSKYLYTIAQGVNGKAPEVTHYVYDDAGKNQLRFLISPEGRVTEYRYDAKGQRTSTIVYEGNQFTPVDLTIEDPYYPADPNAPIPSDPDPSSPADAVLARGGAAVQDAVPGGHSFNLALQYTETNLAAVMPDLDPARTSRTDMVYDTRGQLLGATSYSTIDATGAGVADGSEVTTAFVYNLHGQLLSTIDANGGGSQFAYDGLGRLLSVTDPAGHVTLSQYDDAGNRTTVTQANGAAVVSSYDAAGRLTSVLSAVSGAVTQYAYDADGRLTRTTAPTGQANWMLYDDAGNLAGTIDADGSLTEYVHDGAGQVTQTVQFANAVDINSLAASGNVLAALRPVASADDVKTWQVFDGAHQLVATVGGDGAVTRYVYDGEGRLDRTIAYANRLDTTGFGGVLDDAVLTPPASGDDRMARNFYTDDNLLAGRLDAEGYLTTYQYDAAGRMIRANAYPVQVDAGRRATTPLADVLPGLGTPVGSIYFYNHLGRQTGSIDANGYATENLYDDNGNLTTQVRYATLEPRQNNSPDALVRPSPSSQDLVTTWTYDSLNRVATRTDPSGTVSTSTYDQVGNLTAVTTAAGSADARTVTSRYDLLGRLTGQVGGAGSALLDGNQTQAEADAIFAAYGTSYSYDAAGRRISATDPQGNTTRYYYDADSHLTETVNALGEVTQYRYNALNEMVGTVAFATRIDPAVLGAGGVATADQLAQFDALRRPDLDSTTSVTYTTGGAVASTTDARGIVTTHGYDAFGDETARTIAAGQGDAVSDSFAFDHRGMLIASTVDVGGIAATSSVQYDAFGRAIVAIDANGNITRYARDALGQVVTVTDGTNRSQGTSYDAFGRVLATTDAYGQSTTYTYDPAARSTTIRTPEGVTVTSVVNRDGETQSVTDGKGNTTSYSYDLDGNHVGTATPLSASGAVFDHAGRLVDAIDANGHVVRYAYDAANRVLSRTVDPAGLALTTTYAYDALGRQVQVTDAAGQVTRYEYELDGHIKRQIVDPDGLALVTSFTYDSRGNTLTTTTPDGLQVQYVYDKLDRRTEEHVDPAGLNLTTRYTYDQNGNVVARTDPAGQVQRYAYDAANRLAYTVDALGNAVAYTYDNNGRAVRTLAYAQPISLGAWGDAVTGAQIQARLVATAGDNDVRRVYDRDGRLTFTTDATGAVTQLQYDGNGNVAAQIAYANRLAVPFDGVGVPAPVADPAHDVVNYTGYDQLNRAVYSIDGSGGVTTTSYDGAGNVTAHTVYANRVDLAQWDHVTAPVPGDTSSDARTLFVYDAADRLAYTLDGNGAVRANHYDGDGRLVDQTTYATTLGGWSPLTLAQLDAAVAGLANAARDSHVRMVYDLAGRLVWQADGTGAVVQNTYDRNGNLVARTAYANRIAAGAAPSSVVPGDTDRTVRMAYDGADRMAFQIDAAGALTGFTYDALGNVVTRTAYASLLALAGNPSAAELRQLLVTDPANDRVWNMTWDADGRMVFQVDALGAVSEMQYDAFGAVTATIAYANAVNPASLGSPAASADVRAMLLPDASRDRISRTVYDAAGAPAWRIDAGGYVTRTLFDGAGRATDVTIYALAVPADVTPTPAALAAAVTVTAADQHTHIAYDAAGNVVATTDALGLTETSTYDGLGNKLTYTNRNNATWSYQYDGAGRIIVETGPPVTLADVYGQGEGDPTLWLGGLRGGVGVVTRMTYDGLGNVMARTEAAGLAEERTTQYEYDAAGRQVRVIYPPVQVYNAQENLASNYPVPSAAIGDNMVQLDTLTSYDAFGDAIGNRDVAGNMSYKTYDRQGHVSYAIDAEGFVTGYQRNAFGEVTSLTRYAAFTALAIYGYAPSATDVADVLQGVPHGDDRTIVSSYDTLGRLVQVVEPQAYTYDGLQGVVAGKTTRYTYDTFGNAVQTAVLQNAVTNSWAVSTAYFDRLGRQSAAVDALGYFTTNAYDAEGNLVTHVEYANATGGATPAGYAMPAASQDDRITVTAWDLDNRRIATTMVNVEFSVSPDGSSMRGDTITRYGYDGVGNQTSVTDATGAITTTVYDALGRVSAILAPAYNVDQVGTVGVATEFLRDAYGNVVAQVNHAGAVDAIGVRTTLSRYDSFGRLLQTQDANGHSIYYAYDASGNLAKQQVTVMDNDGVQSTLFTAYRYDKLGNQVDAITAAPTGAFLTNQFDGTSMNSVWSNLVDPNGAPVRVEVDYEYQETVYSGGRSEDTLVVNVNPDPPVTQIVQTSASATFNAADVRTGASVNLMSQLETGQTYYRTVAVRIYQGDQALWQSEPYYALTSAVVQVPQSVAGLTDTHMRYNAFGEMVGKGINGSEQEYFDYDGAGHLWRTNSGDGVVKVALYDVAGNVTADIRGLTVDLKAVGDAAQAAGLAGVERTDYRRDLLGRTVAQTQAERDGVRPVVTQTLDRWGNVLEVSDPRSAYWKTIYRYNANNQVLEVHAPDAAGNQSADSAVTSTYYDALGLAVATRDGNGNVNGMVYDGAGNLTTELHADGGIVSYRYDALGQRVGQTDAIGNNTGYAFDAVGNLVQVFQGDGTSLQYTYDEANRQLSMTNGNYETIRYKYDGNGNVIQTTQPMGEKSYSLFNALNQKIADVNATGAMLSWTYDYFGHVTTHRDLGGALALYYYDPVTIRLLNMQSSRGQNVAYAYDNIGQLQQINDMAVGRITDYRYDLAGNRTIENTWVNGTLLQNNTVYFDALNRISHVSGPGEFNLTYDKAGNRLNETISVDGGGSQSLWYAYDSMNRQILVDGAVDGNVANAANLVDGQGHVVTYDKAGNRTSDTTFTDRIVEHNSFGLDESGNQVQVTEYLVDKGAVKQTYTFDGMGRVAAVFNQTFTSDDFGQVQAGAESAVLDIRTYDGAGRVLSTGLLPGLDTTVTQGYLDALVKTGAGIGTTHRTNSYDADGRILQQTVSGSTPLEAASVGPIGVSIDGIASYDPALVAAVQQALLADSTGTAATNPTLGQIEAAIHDAAVQAAQANADNLHQQANAAGAARDAAIAYAASLPANDPRQPQAIADANALSAVADDLAAQAAAADGQVAALGSTVTGGAAYFVYDDSTIYNSALGQQAAQFHVQNEITYSRYDPAGNLINYSTATINPDGSTALTVEYGYSWGLFESYKQLHMFGTRSDGGPMGRTDEAYDANGDLVSVTDIQEPANNRTFLNDANGIVLQKTQDGHDLHQIVVSGQLFGTFGDTIDPDKPVNDDGTPNYIHQAQFNLGYRAVDSNYPTATAGSYTVQAGDTLQSIAQDAYGDSQLWYLIADANGISGALHAGTTLVLPNRLGGIHNDNSSFRVYDPSRVVGDTTPNLPAPASQGDSGGGCSGLGQLLLVVVAIVVTIYTAGAAGAAIFGAEASLAAGTLAGAVSFAIGGAVGSIASQLVGNALGITEGFSWKAVALSAIGSSIGSGLGGLDVSAVAGTSTIATAAVRAALGSALTQGIGVVTGLQEKFSWIAVAASAAAAGAAESVNGALLGDAISSGLGRTMNTGFADALGNGAIAKIAANTLAGIASGVTQSVVRGGKIELGNIAVDAFGNALGNSLNDAIQAKSDTLAGASKASGISFDQDRANRLAANPLANWMSSNQGSAEDFGLLPINTEVLEAIPSFSGRQASGVSSADGAINLGDGRYKLPNGHINRSSGVVETSSEGSAPATPTDNAKPTLYRNADGQLVTAGEGGDIFYGLAKYTQFEVPDVPEWARPQTGSMTYVFDSEGKPFWRNNDTIMSIPSSFLRPGLPGLQGEAMVAGMIDGFVNLPGNLVNGVSDLLGVLKDQVQHLSCKVPPWRKSTNI